MKFIVRWLFRLLILAITLAIALVLLKDVLLEEYLEAQFRRATGIEVQLGRVESALFSPVLTLESVRLYNPPEFGGAPFLDASEIHLEYDRAALLRGTLALRLLRVNLAELVVVEDGQGGQNLRALLVRAAATFRNRGGAPFEFGGIGTLNLTVERIRRQNLRDPSRNTMLQPAIRGVVLQNLRTGADLARVLTGLALRHGLGPVLGLTPPANPPGAGPAR
jgi:uncharacterized protein involved in outer membrane biogenesis